MSAEDFITEYVVLAEEIHKLAREKGFWTKDTSAGEKIALIHSEISEALEALRDGEPVSEKIPPHLQIEEELADAIIRIMDFGARYGYCVASAIVRKMEYNATRPHKHGRKF